MSTREDPRWWILPEGETWEDSWKRTVRIVKALDEELADEKERMAKCARLYDPRAEFLGTETDMRTGPYPLPYDTGPRPVSLVRSAIDTVCSMIAKNRPRAAFVTDDADWSQARRAEDLEKVVEGEFQKCEVYDDAVRAFRDGTAAGLGGVKVTIDDDSGYVEVEKISWDCLVIDRIECLTGPPRQIHEVRFIDREALIEMYPDHEDEIRKLPGVDTVRWWTGYRSIDAGLVEVIESWKIGKDGIHSICTEGITFLWEDYTDDWFPFCFFRWAERLTGFFGSSLSEELAGIQSRVDRIMWHIARCHDMSNTYLVVQAIDAGLRVKASGGSNPLQVLPYKGQIKPEFEVPEAVPQELYRHLEYLISLAYQMSGVSEMSATSQKPAGLESAVALQTFSDIETQRFSIVAQRYERFILDIARMIVKTLKKAMARKRQDQATVWKTHNAMKRIKWEDVDLDEDLYTISIEASSLLSRTPAGRIQAAIELGNANLFDRDELRKLIGHPDLERTMSLDSAALDHADRIVERLINNEVVIPEIFDNLPVVSKVIQNYYLRAKDRNAPEYILDGFRQWMTTAQRTLTELATAQAPSPAEQAAQPATPGPGGPPMPPPVPKPPQLEVPPQAVA